MKNNLIAQCIEHSEYDIPYSTQMLLQGLASYLKDVEKVNRCANCRYKQPVYHNKLDKVVQYCFYWEKPTTAHNYCGHYKERGSD